MTVSLAMQPGRTNVVNTVIITLKDRVTDKPITNAQIKVTTNMQIMDMGIANKELSADNNAAYMTTFQPDEAFSMIGAWNISLTIQQPGQAVVQTQFVVTLTS